VFQLPSRRQTDAALLILRLITGVTFAAHGWQKLFVFGPENLAAGFGQMGVPFPALTGLLVGLLEFGGGILLAVGVLTRLMSLGLAITMLGALFLVHLDAGFFMPNGYEFVLTLFGASVSLLLMGAGGVSVDAMLARRGFGSVRAQGGEVAVARESHRSVA